MTMDKEAAEQVQQVQQACADRAAMYRLFASLVDKEVNDDTRDALVRLSGVPCAPGATSAERECARGLRTMAAYVQDFDQDVSDQLACEFATIFLASGTYTGKAAVPYESIYTSEEHILMQDARDQVRALYRAARVMPQTKESIPEDYLPFELEFMALLADRMAKAAKDGDAEAVADLAGQQKAFLHDHLADWVPDWIKDVNRMATSEFYHSLAEAIEGYLACEDSDLDELASFVGVDAA